MSEIGARGEEQGLEQKVAKEAKEEERQEIEQEVTEATEREVRVEGETAALPEEEAGKEQKETNATKATKEKVEAEAGDDLRLAEDQSTLTPTLSHREREQAARVEHPVGEVFFRGSGEEITEGEAEEIARRQLTRSGLLRGQKVRVAD